MRNVRPIAADGPDRICEAAPARHAAPTGVQGVRPYLSAEQLTAVTPWSLDAIKHMIARGVLKRSVHYFRPLGRRRELLFKWAAIVEMIEQSPAVVEEPATRQPKRVGIDVEQATANFERLLG